MEDIDLEEEPWKLKYTEKAEKDLYKLESEKAQKILKKLEEARENPKVYFERLQEYDDHKLRSGDYRVIAILNYEEKIIKIEAVGHRKNIYKKFNRRKKK